MIYDRDKVVLKFCKTNLYSLRCVLQKAAKAHAKPNLNLTLWNITTAQKVLKSWQRSFTHSLYNHEWNFVIEPGSSSKYVYRRIHPLASTSVADMLEEFCKFNYIIIFVG